MICCSLRSVVRSATSFSLRASSARFLILYFNQSSEPSYDTSSIGKFPPVNKNQKYSPSETTKTRLIHCPILVQLILPSGDHSFPVVEIHQARVSPINDVRFRNAGIVSIMLVYVSTLPSAQADPTRTGSESIIKRKFRSLVTSAASAPLGVLRALAVLDVGIDPVPPEDIATLIQQRGRAHQCPAILTVCPPHPAFEFAASFGFHHSLPDLQQPRQIVRMKLGEKTEPLEVLEPAPDIVEVMLIEELRHAIGRRGPNCHGQPVD